MTKQVLLTEEGLAKLELELDELKTVKRTEIAEKIKVALSFGDLSENSEYDEAKNDQAVLEARIATVEAMLKNVKIIDESEITTEYVNVGSKIKVCNLKTNTEMLFKIVGSSESDPSQGFISDESPVGKGLIGKKVGETSVIEIPAGITEYKVLEISK